MIENKTLTEEDIKELSEEQLTKVSGGYTDGQICPQCGQERVIFVKEKYGLYCRHCGWTCKGSPSDFE